MMKRLVTALFSPFSLGLSGAGIFTAGAIACASGPDQNAPVIVAASLVMAIAIIIWAVLACTLAVRFFRFLRSRRQRAMGSAQPLPRPKRQLLPALAIAIFLTGVAAAFLLTYGPLADSQTIASADPAMVQLAHEAGMSREGELIFLRTHPQLVSDSDMQLDCAGNTAANNSNGFIEQGCYVPATNKIYLRKMPDDLHALVVSTASYEMLHPVYIALHNTAKSAALDAAIEANFTSINDAGLNDQVANFAKTEPGAQDLELFSLLGTGYDNLTDGLDTFYAPYFDDISATVAADHQVKQLFRDDQEQLDNLNAQIKQDDNLANDAYASSASWAHDGNQYLDDYYYNQYRQYLGQENGLIGQYNQLLASYNALVTEFNGSQPVQQINPAQTQAL